jgi:hypothetical protein
VIPRDENGKLHTVDGLPMIYKLVEQKRMEENPNH